MSVKLKYVRPPNDARSLTAVLLRQYGGGGVRR